MKAYSRFVIRTSCDAWGFGAIALALSTGLVALGIYMSHASGIKFGHLLRDFASIAKLSPVYSSLELAGAMITAGAVAVTFFGAFLAGAPWRRFLTMAGLLSFVMCLDDVYLFHERGFFLHLSEETIYLFYLFALLGLFVANRAILAATPLVLLVISFGLFGGAALADHASGTRYVALLPSGFEDMLELTAFIFWASYFVACARTAIVNPGSARAAEGVWEDLMLFLMRPFRHRERPEIIS